MKETTIIGIDLAKRTFHLHGMTQDGEITIAKKVSREKLLGTISLQKNIVIAMEACAGSHYWGREFKKLGHEVRLISPKLVKPYVKSQKNDANDAAAIAEAASRKHMRFVPLKTERQQDILTLHRIRSRQVKCRTQLVNEMRALLHERGVIFPQKINIFRKQCALFLQSTESSALGNVLHTEMREMMCEMNTLDQRIAGIEYKIKESNRADPRCQRLLEIPGVGELISSAIVAAVGDAKNFPTGRHLSAWLGLIPRQHSTGGKTRLSSITKQGDPYIRWLLCHGARAALSSYDKRIDRTGFWAHRLKERVGFKKATIALANKMVRQIWVILNKGIVYNPQL